MVQMATKLKPRMTWWRAIPKEHGYVSVRWRLLSLELELEIFIGQIALPRGF